MPMRCDDMRGLAHCSKQGDFGFVVESILAIFKLEEKAVDVKKGICRGEIADRS
jgi:hypothetical protein